MIKEVKYRGVTTTPSDYESPDGDLASSSGIVLDGGRLLVPKSPDVVVQGGTTLTFTKKPVFKHVTTDGILHWITYGSVSEGEPAVIHHYLYSKTGSEIETKITGLNLSGEPKSIQAIGNTLVVVDTDGSLRYVVCKNSVYTYLDDHIPTVEIQFGLNGALKRDVTDNLLIGEYFDGGQEEDLTIRTGCEDVVTNRVMGEIELAMKKSGDDDDKFSAPFLVRYALKLYDGSYTNFSAPVLMDNNFGESPVVAFWAQGQPGKLKSFSIYNVYSDLTAQRKSINTELNGWEDIVKSIDIFVSRQFRNYDPLGKVGTIIRYYGNYVDTSEYMEDSPLAHAFSSNGWSDLREGATGKGYVRDSYFGEYANYFNDATLDHTETRPRYQFMLPYYSDDELIGEQRGKITQNSSFYKLHTLKLTTIERNGSTFYGNETIDGTDLVVPVESGVIANIETQQSLNDDYFSNDKLSANTLYVYNARIMAADISRTPFSGFSPSTLNAPFHQTEITPPTLGVTFKILIDENNSKMMVESSGEVTPQETTAGKYYGILPTYFYYPNPNAKTLVVEVDTGGQDPVVKKINLLPHPSLNGAYYVDRGELNLNTTDVVDTRSYTDTKVSYPNQIYTSKSYNPYVFEASGVNEIGGGAEIKVLASNTQALSQGQFGQFPLYAFTNLGIWAMEMAKNGEFSSLSPVTRDIILGDGESLTQLDDSLLFATKQGIMELVGKNTKCISTELDVKSDLPTLKNFGWMIDPTAEDPEDIQPIGTDFKTFIVGCKMVYDYVNARVVVFNPTSDYAYIYSAKDKAWSIISPYNLFDTINAYPDAQAVAKETTTVNNTETTTYSIVDLSTITDEQVVEQGQPEPTHEGWFITRPIDLDAPNDFKLIDVVRQNGVFEEYLVKNEHELYEGKSAMNDGHTVIKQILYGSNDLINWFVIGSSDSRLINGRTSAGFKWFRLAVKSTLKPGESLSSVTFSYRIKAENPHLF